MNLMIDVGNSQTKYACFLENKICFKSVSLEREIFDKIDGLGIKVTRILVSRVKPLSRDLLKQIDKRGLKLEKLEDFSLPFINNYQTPQTIGSDRVALVAGGMSLFPQEDLIIIDLGSCITFDFIDAKAVYHGGAISPGLKMRLQALNRFTAKLPLIKFTEPKDFIGKTTLESIVSGVFNGISEELLGTIQLYKKRFPKIKVVLTGGDAVFFEKKLKNSIFADAEILFKGMNFIMRQDAGKKS